MLQLFTITIFIGSALLFLVQPMVAKWLLPMLGGSPSVWTGCMVFFQAALLAGYAYAHGLSRIRSMALRLAIHAIAVTVSLAPLALYVIRPKGWITPSGEGPPLVWLLVTLISTIGLPFVVVSTGSSLLQSWFSRTRHPRASDPYFLYVASNAGSLLGLLVYPFGIEPYFTLGGQRSFWAFSFVVWSVLVLVCGVKAAREALPTERTETAGPSDPPASWADRGAWTLLSMVPASLVVGTTHVITTELSPVPLLWVVPLALYLASFIVAFSRFGGVCTTVARIVMPPVLIGVVAASYSSSSEKAMPFIAAIHLVLIFVAGVACHGMLAARRPGASRLTEYYFWIALGGVLGGSINAVVGPLVFNAMIEHPVMLGVAWMVSFPTRGAGSRSWFRFTRYGTGLACMGALVYAAIRPPRPDVEILARERSFYGSLRVLRAAGAEANELIHGSITHGAQLTSGEKRFVPTTYYSPTGPIGEVILSRAETGGFKHMAAVGLGVGTLAAYGQVVRNITFFEIDPAVVKVARDSGLFSYIKDSDAKVDIVLGDARLMLARQPDESYDLIVLDAFSSDAVPVHLLTFEAIRMYMHKLTPDGVLAIHVSNRHVALAEQLSAMAGVTGLHAWIRNDRDTEITEAERVLGKTSSRWVVLSLREANVGSIASQPERWRKNTNPLRRRVWTDDYSDLLRYLRWRL